MERRFEVDPQLYPFESHWYTSGAAPLHYLDEGEGPAVLLLHGNPTWSFAYRDVIRELSGRCRAIAPDYPGFGLSSHPEGYGYSPAGHAAAVGELVAEVERELAGDGRVLLRYSGTEPVARVMVEGPDREKIGEQAGRIAEAITAAIGA